MKRIATKYKEAYNREFVISFAVGILALIISLVINYYAGIYATKSASNSVTDIILSNIRVYNVDDMFVYGPLIFWVFVSAVLLLKPKTIPFTIKSIALFVIIRSISICLTHIGPFPTKVLLESNALKDFTFGGDLFFSAHTGLPFLMALVFWKDIKLRILFIASSLFFGTVVLLGHLHYSIDVFSAFFITYTIFHLSEMFFKKDRKLFGEETI